MIRRTPRCRQFGYSALIPSREIILNVIIVVVLSTLLKKAKNRARASLRGRLGFVRWHFQGDLVLLLHSLQSQWRDAARAVRSRARVHWRRCAALPCAPCAPGAATRAAAGTSTKGLCSGAAPGTLKCVSSSAKLILAAAAVLRSPGVALALHGRHKRT